MATHFSILARRIPWTRGAWQAIVHKVTRESDMTEQLNNNSHLLGNISPGSQSPVPSWKNTQGQHLILSRHPRVIPSILQVLDPGKEMVTLSPLNQRERGKEQSLWQKQIPETTGYEHHITLFLWFSNFTFGQCKVKSLTGLAPVWSHWRQGLGSKELNRKMGSPRTAGPTADAPSTSKQSPKALSPGPLPNSSQ